MSYTSALLAAGSRAAAALYAQAATTTTEAPAQQAPNPILPSSTELLWGTVSFAVLAFLMWKFAFPLVIKAMQARTDKIRSNLDEAENVRQEAQGILEEYQRQLADARTESNRIIEEARQAADQLRQDMVRRADEEVAELRRRSIEDLKAAQDRVMGQLRLQVRDLAIELAEKVVGANLDRERNLALVDQMIAELEARPAGGG
ncbi:MAG: F-type H+-transporting ATPase subunit b [Acidimicrobiaceae bacterium]|jgi:F-type H+-transporting ATPase subunit b|nr:F-type H+-transporting ATPase subunit b [Acidimicrobiaceae bacterium]MDQ1365385.1 F-type H+-transporting ATPase subunit b [Acidimicrobiaceae bacterium]MDQ1369141.1 F-type H+-transporting ATPase subunit b [Acidimicrobiaceae bacterium]MDQ1399423.1 F-type H+-transporting ATPase subunit b [Acidimicrobiaceae bacterium]MDQ1413945.1 F-type H+-transporting ATPase subunit b [Acidimicrobiaceae bacterium]